MTEELKLWSPERHFQVRTTTFSLFSNRKVYMKDFRARLFVMTYPALKLIRWNGKRLARKAVEDVVNRGLALYLPSAPHIEWVAGVRCIVKSPPKMSLGEAGAWEEGE